MKKFLLSTILALTAATVGAQDAFYIYQNDGHFDGFFYDEVQKISYSKIDTLGFEHEDYVSQEIITADSVYRIMLTAIDSVGFVQPEIIFNPRMVNIDETGLTQYVENAYDNKLFLKKDTPSELLPKEGDVLVSFGTDIKSDIGVLASEDHEYGGFGGKVVNVQHFPQYGFIQVNCEKLTQISDVFQQFIAVERVSTDEHGNVRRRLSGFDYDAQRGRWVRKGEDKGSHFNLIDFSGTLHHDFGNSSFNLGVKLKVSFDIAYNISWKRIYFKLGRTFGASLKPGATLSTSKDFEYEITGIPRFLESIKFPAVAPIFQTRPIPKAFLRGGGDLSVSLTLPELGFNYHESISYDSDLFFPWRFKMFDNGPEEDCLENDTPFNTGDIDLKLSGFVQTGIKFKGNIETNDWFADILQSDISMDIFVGPKIDGSVNLSAATLASGGAYDTMKNWSVNITPISVDLVLSARAKLFWADPVEAKFFEGTLPCFTTSWKAVPNFDDLKVTYDPKRELVETTLSPSGKTFLMNYIGTGLYDYQMNLLSDDMATLPYFLAQSGTFKDLKGKLNTHGLKCGRYYVKPRLKVFGYDVDVNDPMEEIIITPTLSIDKDEENVNGEKQQLQFYVKTNAKEVNVDFCDKEDLPLSDEYFWAKGSLSEINEDGSAVLTVDVEENSTLWNRQGYIVLTAVTDEFSTCDSVLIKQASNFKGFKTVWGDISLRATMKGTTYSEGYGEGNDGTKSIDNDEDAVIVPIRSHDEYSDKDVPITFHRSGDIMTVKGSLTAPFENNSKETYSDGKFKGSSSSNGTTTHDWEIVFDLSEPFVIKFVSASANYSFSSSVTHKNEEWLFEGSDAEYLYETKESSYSEQFSSRASCKLNAEGWADNNKLVFQFGRSSEVYYVTFDQASGHCERHSSGTENRKEYNRNNKVVSDNTKKDKGDETISPTGDKKGNLLIEMIFK